MFKLQSLHACTDAKPKRSCAKITQSAVSVMNLVFQTATILTCHAYQDAGERGNFFQGFSRMTATKKSRTV